MGLKTAGVGHFTIPTAPAAGTSCTSGAANVFTTNYVQLIASTAAALYITGIHVESSAALAATYIVVQLATGGAGAESIVGQYLVPLSTASTVALGYRQIYPPIPVGNATRIACKTADSVGAKATLITLECIAQSNVVDDGIAVGSVAGSVGSVTGAVGSVTGNVGGNVVGSVASVTAAVTLPAIPANWITAAGINAAALNGKGDWLLSSGYTAPLSAAGTRTALGMASANLDTQLSAIAGYIDTEVAALQADVTTLLGRLTAGRASNLDNLDLAVSSRLAAAAYTVPPTTAAIADKFLGRNLAGSADGTRTVGDALRALRNKTSLAAGVLTVYAEDDATPAWTATVTQAARDPITAVDPA